MHQETTSLPIPLPPISSAALESSLLPDGVLPPALRRGSVAGFAVRNRLRTNPVLPSAATLQRCAGMGLSLAAWLLFLGGLAYLILAALHNQNGELGLGMDATFSGTKYFMVSFVLGGVGVWQWVAGERRCRMR